MSLTKTDYFSLQPQIINGNTSCESITQEYLKNVSQNQDLNAFISVFNESALERAREIDQKIAAGKAGRLAGLVLAVKDLLNVEGEKTTCGSKILSSFISPYSATAIEKLKAEDVIFIGKTNMDEFAMGSSNENSGFGPVKNPCDTSRVPGGSSGGSAAAVAGNLCMASLGTDTGGSIRQPASFCGVIGLKPTYGRISRYGLVAYASSLDQIGPITKSLKDSALLLQTMAGHDPHDSTSAPVPVDNYAEFLGRDVAGLKIGLPKEYYAQGLAPSVNSAIQTQLDVLKKAGAEIINISLPHTEYAIAAYYIIATAEASSNLARYDGARYGVRSENSAGLEEMYVNSRSEGFGAEVKRRIMLGTYVLSSGYYDAYYKKAQQARTLIKNDFQNALNTVDCIITPTAPTTAFSIGEKSDDPLTMYLSDIYTVSLNLAGLPGISIPVGKDADNLPIGMQLIGNHFAEGTLYQIADVVLNNSKEL